MTDLQDVHKMYSETLHIENTHIIDISIAAYVGKDIMGEPIWLNPVAPSGFGKTTTILPFIDLSFNWKDPNNKENLLKRKYDIFFVDDLTSATFGSGSIAKKADADLGHWLTDRKTFLIISDLSPVLTMDADSKNKLFGKFRTLYDGYIKVDTGAGNKYYKNIHMNMLAFATAEVKRHLDLHTSLGTREVTYDVPKIERLDDALAKKDSPNARESRSAIMKNFIDDLSPDWNYAQEQYNEVEKIIFDLAKRVTYWRASAIVDDDGYLVQHVEPEYPMRIKNQLTSLFKAFSAIGIHKPMQTLLEIVNTCGNPLRREILDKMFVVENDTHILRERPLNAFYLSNLMGLSPTTILTNLFALRDMFLIAPIQNLEEKFNEKISFTTRWVPIVKYHAF